LTGRAFGYRDRHRTSRCTSTEKAFTPSTCRPFVSCNISFVSLITDKATINIMSNCDTEMEESSIAATKMRLFKEVVVKVMKKGDVPTGEQN
jgi:hypothetical protein